ncbi:hypothetical protein M8R61_21240 [Enterobacter hormaechei]|nr:hypothetical protein [Enterobacter hormaechei]
MKNESAFPIPATEYHGMDSGMTLRDFFAAQVINGIISDPNAALLQGDLLRHARVAYKAADAMLMARER